MNTSLDTELKTGYKLDAIVAEKVMGWTDIHESRLGYYYVGNFPGTPDICQAVAPYSTDVACAWAVVEKLREDGWCIDIRIDEEPWQAPQLASADSETNTYDVSLLGCNRGRTDATSVRAYAGTMPLAICLAALKAGQS